MKHVWIAALFALSGLAQAAGPQVEMWKTPTCGCCKDWVRHLEDNGFDVKVHDVADTSAQRAALGIPSELGSCHSARVEGYALEGHVPASEIKRLLKERPKAVGLAVPGMPLGAPGMDDPAYRGVKHEYRVLLVDKSGSYRNYRPYPGNQTDRNAAR
ncbi:MAG: DUF411 domain-containing protein [Rhodocyclaceae bacterium]|nr:DUF411 domain-containing protein [Rhodocyclaceae bacterium]